MDMSFGKPKQEYYTLNRTGLHKLMNMLPPPVLRLMVEGLGWSLDPGMGSEVRTSGKRPDLWMDQLRMYSKHYFAFLKGVLTLLFLLMWNMVCDVLSWL